MYRTVQEGKGGGERGVGWLSNVAKLEGSVLFWAGGGGADWWWCSVRTYLDTYK